ncbi:MAG: long-chain-fatty-acid--CoA ligase [Actinomycetota bacterium]
MNVSDVVRDSAMKDPAKAAILFQDRVITYGDLDAEIDLVAGGIVGLGLRQGDRVGLLVHNVPQFISAYYGIARAGCVTIPLNTMLTADEISFILTDADARMVIASDPFAPTVDGLRQTLAMLDHVVVTGDHAPTGAMTWSQLLGIGTSRVVPAPTVLGKPRNAGGDPGSLALLAYTSGTTGKPKGAMLSHENLLANLEQMSGVPALDQASDDVVLLVLPLFHIYALNAILGLTMKVGATALLMERFDAIASLEAIQKHRATVVFAAPPMFIAWNNTPGIATYDLSSVRLACSGAAPLPGPVLEQFQRRTGITIWESYGLTETAPGVTSNAMGSIAKPGSIGKPLPGVEVRILDEDGDDVEDGDPGEIVVRGPNVFRGYFNHPEYTAEALSADGWFRTGDIGYADEDGYIFLVDRKKDLVIVSGFNVYPREVEDVIYRHPKVSEVAAIGIPHPYTGEAVKALVVLKPGETATEEELLDFCRKSLARFKCPSTIEFVRELPHLATGKVAKRVIRAGGLGDASLGPQSKT